jgi:hypothetical protein
MGESRFAKGPEAPPAAEKAEAPAPAAPDLDGEPARAADARAGEKRPADSLSRPAEEGRAEGAKASRRERAAPSPAPRKAAPSPERAPAPAPAPERPREFATPPPPAEEPPAPPAAPRDDGRAARRDAPANASDRAAAAGEPTPAPDEAERYARSESAGAAAAAAPPAAPPPPRAAAAQRAAPRAAAPSDAAEGAEAPRAAASGASDRYAELRREGRLRGEIRTFPGCEGEGWRKVELGPDGEVVKYVRQGWIAGRRLRIEHVYGPDGALASATAEDLSSGDRLDPRALGIAVPERAEDARPDAPPRCGR